jgi:hypothetical protein
MKSGLRLGYCAVVLSLLTGTVSFGLLGIATPMLLLAGIVTNKRWFQLIGALLLSVSILVPFAIALFESRHNLLPQHDINFIGITSIWFLAVASVVSYDIALARSISGRPKTPSDRSPAALV